jgi:hypothetical protein
VTTITAAIARLCARAHREHRSSVEAAAMRLLVALGGAEALERRAELRVVGEGRDVVHELLVDGAAVWWLRRGRRQIEATWLVEPETLR